MSHERLTERGPAHGGCDHFWTDQETATARSVYKTIVQVWAWATATGAACPGCRVVSRRVHGGYQRRVSDLPVGQQPVLVRLWVRRFVCGEADCPRRTFVEQVEGLTRRYGRRSLGLQRMLEAVETFVAGRAGARLAA